jgi:hypothetical protein
MSELEKAMETVVEKAVSETRERPSLNTVSMPHPVSLSDQWIKLERIEAELRTRIRRERMAITAEYERLVVETNQDFDRRADDMATKLEADRRNALQTLANGTAEKLREHELLSKRMNRD